jgi:hypothetical protein
MGLYGYYRGYNNIYNEKNFNKPNDLLIDVCQDFEGYYGF